jgi:hypothetical protein
MNVNGRVARLEMHAGARCRVCGGALVCIKCPERPQIYDFSKLSAEELPQLIALLKKAKGLE